MRLYPIFVIAGYLIGSIPFGYIIVKLIKGIDIRMVGSGNIGATNVGRVLGLPWGILCFILDMLKGAVPIYIEYHHLWPPLTERAWGYGFVRPTGEYSIILGLCLILGHLFPLYLKFKGGKGVATAFGVFIMIVPKPTIIALVCWIVVLLVFRYVSLASIVAAMALLISTILLSDWCFFWSVYYNSWVISACSIVSILVIIRHIPNIKRLINGTEPKVSFKKKDETQK